VNETVRDWAEETRDAAGVSFSQASTSASEIYSQVSTTAASVTGQASEMAGNLFPDSAARDTHLLGAAVLAIGAASVIAYQRRED
jgi:hypothetical protein